MGVGLGTDTVSLARLGAQMTGLDFSPTSVAEARRLGGNPVLWSLADRALAASAHLHPSGRTTARRTVVMPGTLAPRQHDTGRR